MAGNGESFVIHMGCGEIETGLWCPSCLKSSGFRLPLYSLIDSGVSQIGVVEKCDECERPLGDGCASD